MKGGAVGWCRSTGHRLLELRRGLRRAAQALGYTLTPDTSVEALIFSNLVQVRFFAGSFAVRSSRRARFLFIQERSLIFLLRREGLSHQDAFPADLTAVPVLSGSMVNRRLDQGPENLRMPIICVGLR